MTSTARPRKVAILGGGAGALTAAFELTSEPGWKDRYELTVYQVGWRLGGKGASGRDRRCHDRIEEHGLHLWLGCYENAFRVMRAAYQELGRGPAEPLATWDRAFTPWPIAGVMEHVGEEWLSWAGRFELNDELPGQGKPFLSVWNLIGQGLELLRTIFSTTPIGAAGPGLLAPLRALVRGGRGARRAGDRPGAAVLERLGAAIRVARGGQERRLELVPLLRSLTDALWTALGPEVEQSTLLRRTWIMTDLVTSVIRGLLVDDAVTKGFDVLDDQDLVAWLGRHGARSITIESAFVRGIYDFAFADHPSFIPGGSFAAGSSVRLMLRMVLNYRGSMFYRMEGGMGDVVFTPIYEVLRRRGVRFEFFHAVQSLGLSADGREIATIEVDRQVRLKAASGTDAGRYDPLYEVAGLPCWPSEPSYDQIEDGAELEAGWHAKSYQLESHWSAWKPVERRTLRRGEDFDLVVFGLSMGSIPHVCAELVAARPAWRAMVEHLTTTKTQNMQLWFRPSLRGLGFTGEPAVVDAYAQPFNTYADMAHLIRHERWPTKGAETPADIAYFCGALDDDEPAPPPEDHDYPVRQQRRVREAAEKWLSENARPLWPNATTAHDPAALDWNLLVDPARRLGVERLDAQFFRANIDPSDRYVRSPKGSARHRLEPGGSGVDNLFLAGDWTRNGINVGNVEAAVTSGMLAARAVAGLAGSPPANRRPIAWIDGLGA